MNVKKCKAKCKEKHYCYVITFVQIECDLKLLLFDEEIRKKIFGARFSRLNVIQRQKYVRYRNEESVQFHCEKVLFVYIDLY